MKKILPTLLVFIILSNAFFFQPRKAEAFVGKVIGGVATPIVRGSVAEKIFVAEAEKTGVKFTSKKARDQAVDRWNMEIYEKYAKETAENKAAYDSMVARMNTAEIEALPSMPGYGKVVIGGLAFLTGADLIIDVVETLREKKLNQAKTEFLSDYANATSDGKTLTGLPGVSVSIEPDTSNDKNNWINFHYTPYDSTSPTYTGVRFGKEFAPPAYYFLPGIQDASSWLFTAVVEPREYYSGSYQTSANEAKLKMYLKAGTVTNAVYSAIPEEIPAPSYPEVMQPYTNNEVDPVGEPLPENFPQDVELIVPLGELADPATNPTPVNEPIKATEPNPTPGDGDGGGGETPPDDSTGKKIDWSKFTGIGAALTKVFPFSIPWDFYEFFGQFNVEPETPVFNINLHNSFTIFGKTIPFDMDWKIDFSVFDVIAKIIRWGLIICFDIYMITALRKYTPD